VPLNAAEASFHHQTKSHLSRSIIKGDAASRLAFDFLLMLDEMTDHLGHSGREPQGLLLTTALHDAGYTIIQPGAAIAARV
jgi:hypothetical protein